MPAGRQTYVRSNGPVPVKYPSSTNASQSQRSSNPTVRSTHRPAQSQPTWTTATLKLDLDFDTEPPGFETMYWQTTGSGTMDANGVDTLDILTEDMCPTFRGGDLPWKTDGSLNAEEQQVLSSRLQQLCNQRAPNVVEMVGLRNPNITDQRDETGQTMRVSGYRVDVRVRQQEG